MGPELFDFDGVGLMTRDLDAVHRIDISFREQKGDIGDRPEIRTTN